MTGRTSSFRVNALDHVAIRVSDLSRAKTFYQCVLGLIDADSDAWGGVPTLLFTSEAGSGTGIALFPAEHEADPDEPGRKGLAGYDHFAFRVDDDAFDEAVMHLQALGVEHQCKDHGDLCRSVYFKDPDGHQLEITAYKQPVT